MPLLRRSTKWAYLIAIAGTLLLTATRLIPDGSYRSFLGSLIFIVSVSAAGAMGGWKPGFLATVLSALAGIFFLLKPYYTLRLANLTDALRIAAYIFAGGTISILCECLHRSWKRIEDRQQRLEREVAERRRAELAIQAASQQLRIVTESMSALVSRCSRDFNYLWVSKSYADWIGRPAEEIVGRPIAEILGKEAFEQLRPYFDRVISGEEVRYEEAANFYGRGRRWINAVYSPTFGPDGTTDGWVAVVVDVEERKLAENKLRESEERLAAELEGMTRLHAVSTRLLTASNLETALNEILDAAIAVCRADFGCIERYDSDADALTIVAQQGFHDEFLKTYGSPLPRALGGTRARRAQQVVIEDVLADADFAPFREMAASAGFRSLQSTCLVARGGELLGILSTYSGVPRALEERELRLLDLLARLAVDGIERTQAAEFLEESAKRKDEFLAALAHELRNPLAPIRNALEIIRLAGDDPAAVDQARATMERQLRQMVRLVDDLLDVSRITRGAIELRRQRIDVATAVQGAVETSQPLIDHAGHQLSVILPREPVFVDADVTRLAQVFSNLLNNAAKYTDPGGQIWLAVRPEGNTVAISIGDNGIGIPKAMLSRVFEMFRQIGNSLERSHGGLGIGLTIVQRLVEMHGGTVEAKSEGEGKGSEFIVRLPVVASPTPTARVVADDDGGTAFDSRRRILVVDDNRDAASSLAMMLQILGNDTQIAHDGLEALDAAAAYRPQIVLLDIGMPKLSGYDVCRRIRQEPWGGDMVIVAVTGWGKDEDRQNSRAAGFNYHLVKPIEPATLQRVFADLSCP